MNQDTCPVSGAGFPRSHGLTYEAFQGPTSPPKRLQSEALVETEESVVLLLFFASAFDAYDVPGVSNPVDSRGGGQLYATAIYDGGSESLDTAPVRVLGEPIDHRAESIITLLDVAFDDQ